MKRRAIGLATVIAAIYLTIWPHELGHAFAAYHFGCKANGWQTDTTWYLLNSWGGAIDYDCLAVRGRLAQVATDFGGIAVNLLLLGLAPLLGRWWRRDLSPLGTWWFLATFVWALAHYAEAFSYLVLNTAWLKSDMAGVVEASGLSRWIWFACGTALATLIGRALIGPAHRAATLMARPDEPPQRWFRRFALFVGILSLVMAAARGYYT